MLGYLPSCCVVLPLLSEKKLLSVFYMSLPVQKSINYFPINQWVHSILVIFISNNTGLCILFQLVIQLTPSADRKEYFMQQLSKGPALILFLPSKLYMGRVNQHLLEVVSCINISYPVVKRSTDLFLYHSSLNVHSMCKVIMNLQRDPS